MVKCGRRQPVVAALLSLVLSSALLLPEQHVHPSVTSDHYRPEIHRHAASQHADPLPATIDHESAAPVWVISLFATSGPPASPAAPLAIVSHPVNPLDGFASPSRRLQPEPPVSTHDPPDHQSVGFRAPPASHP